jgi:hypothetical protein
MKLFKTKARVPLCGFIFLAFFLPAYQGNSAFQFISIVLSQVNKAYDITTTDAYIAIFSMLLIPFSALLLMIRTALRIATRSIYVAMPLIFFLFFTGLLFTNISSVTNSSRFNAFAHTGIGFYLAALACILLLFTKNPRKKSRRRRSNPEAELAV